MLLGLYIDTTYPFYESTEGYTFTPSIGYFTSPALDTDRGNYIYGISFHILIQKAYTSDFL